MSPSRQKEKLMHDFDADRQRITDADRRFKIGGEEFTHRAAVGPNVMARFMDSPEQAVAECPACRHRFLRGSLRPQQDALAAADEFVLALLEPGQEDKWAKVRADDHPQPLLPREVQELGWKLIGLISQRPTDPPSGSTGTSANGGTRSTANSLSAVEG